MPRPAKEPLPNGLLWCTKGEGHWAHISDFYQKKDGPEYVRPNKVGDAEETYRKPTNSWCRKCILGSRAKKVPPEVARWEAMTLEEQDAEARRLRLEAMDYVPERLGPPELPPSEDEPRRDVRDWISDEALAAINRDAQAYQDDGE